MRKLTMFCLSLMAMSTLVGMGTAQARLDPSFGVGGVVDLVPPPVPAGWSTSGVLEALPTPDGGYLVLTYKSPCAVETSACLTHLWLTRYRADGTLDTGFGGGLGYEIPLLGGPGRPTQTAFDSSGRLVYAAYRHLHGLELVLRRVTANGSPDGAFGLNGEVVVPCGQGCDEVDLLAGTHNSILVASRGFSTPAGGELLRPVLTLIDLNAHGLPSGRFGAPQVTRRINSRAAFKYLARTPGNGFYFGGPESVERVSAKGRKDTRFGREAAVALRRLKSYEGGFGIEQLVVGRKGKVDLFGWVGPSAGFELRLLPSGRLDSAFHDEGVQRFPFTFPAAIAGSEGATMVLSSTERKWGSLPRLYRILANGRIDPAFGKEGEELPGAKLSEVGYQLAPAGRRRVSVVDLGLTFCRQACEFDPKMYRFLEGR